MRKLVLLCIAICGVQVFGQTITVVGDEKGFPVEAAAIYTKDLRISMITNSKGRADISAFANLDTIIISHVSYVDYKTSKTALKKANYRVSLLKKTARLDEVVLSVFRNKENATRIAEQTIALTREDISKRSPQTTADLLASVPGIKVQKSQFGGGSPVLRGMESNRVLLVVDGVRMNNAIYRKGHLQNSITVSPTQLDRTEIVFGPSSVLYGSDALGGVIHYYTKTPKIAEKETVKSSFFSRFGSVNQEVTTSVSAELSFKKWASYTSISYSSFGDLQMGKNRSHGFSDWGLVPNYSQNIGGDYFESPTVNSDPTIQRNTGYNQTDVLQKFYVPLSKKTELHVNLQYSTSSNIPRFDKLSELKSGVLKFAEWYYGPQHRFMASTQLSINPQKKWIDKGTFTVAYQNIKEARIQRKFGDLETYFRNEEVDVFSLNGDFTVPLTAIENRNLSYGFEFSYNDVSSVAEGRTILVSDNKVDGYDGLFNIQSRFPDKGSSYMSGAIYADYRQDLNEKSTLNTGLRWTNTYLNALWLDESFVSLEQDEIVLKNLALTFTMGYVYKPNRDWKINSVISSGFRSPNIDDIGKVREKNGVVTLPNIGLKPEFAYSGEVGVQKFFNDRTFSLGFTTYYTLLQDYITREADGTRIVYNGELGDVVRNVNKSRAYIKGFTTNYFGRLNQNWKTSGFITYTQGKSMDTDEPMSSIPPLFGAVELSYHKKRCEFTASYRFNAKKDISTYNISEGIDNHVQTPIVDSNATNPVDRYYGSPSWMTFGLHARYSINENFTIQSAVTNLFDEHYKEFASGVSSPGRNFSVSVQATF